MVNTKIQKIEPSGGGVEQGRYGGWKTIGVEMVTMVDRLPMGVSR